MFIYKYMDVYCIGVKECLRRMCINIKYVYAIISVVGIYTLHTHTHNKYIYIYIHVCICEYRYRLLYIPLLTPTGNGLV